MTLAIQVRRENGNAVITCIGRLVFGDETRAFHSCVVDALERSPNVILNFDGLRIIDSGGIGTLVGLLTTARNRKGDLRLVGVNERVGRSLQITKLLTLFSVFKSDAEASASFVS
jgi:anti-sigma B factor antagonist